MDTSPLEQAMLGKFAILYQEVKGTTNDPPTTRRHLELFMAQMDPFDLRVQSAFKAFIKEIADLRVAADASGSTTFSSAPRSPYISSEGCAVPSLAEDDKGPITPKLSTFSAAELGLDHGASASSSSPLTPFLADAAAAPATIGLGLGITIPEPLLMPAAGDASPLRHFSRPQSRRRSMTGMTDQGAQLAALPLRRTATGVDQGQLRSPQPYSPPPRMAFQPWFPTRNRVRYQPYQPRYLTSFAAVDSLPSSPLFAEPPNNSPVPELELELDDEDDSNETVSVAPELVSDVASELSTPLGTPGTPNLSWPSTPGSS